MWFPKILTENDMKPIEERIHLIEAKQEACEAQHLLHNRRHTDLSNQSATQTKLLEKIVGQLESFEPTIKRSANNYTTFDTILRWAGGGTVMLGLISAAAAAIYTIKELL